jgi:hypothetical protein
VGLLPTVGMIGAAIARQVEGLLDLPREAH